MTESQKIQSIVERWIVTKNDKAYWRNKNSMRSIKAFLRDLKAGKIPPAIPARKSKRKENDYPMRRKLVKM